MFPNRGLFAGDPTPSPPYTPEEIAAWKQEAEAAGFRVDGMPAVRTFSPQFDQMQPGLITGYEPA